MPRASVEAPYLHFHSPLLAPKAVLNSWRMVVVHTLITRELPAVTGITGWYHLVPRTIYESTVHMYENIGYFQVPGDHLYNTYEYMNAYAPSVTYVWRTWDNIGIYLVLIIHDFLRFLFTVYIIIDNNNWYFVNLYDYTPPPGMCVFHIKPFFLLDIQHIQCPR